MLPYYLSVLFVLFLLGKTIQAIPLTSNVQISVRDALAVDLNIGDTTCGPNAILTAKLDVLGLLNVCICVDLVDVGNQLVRFITLPLFIIFSFS